MEASMVRIVALPSFSEMYLSVSFSEDPRKMMLSQLPTRTSQILSYFALIWVRDCRIIAQEIQYLRMVESALSKSGISPMFANSSRSTCTGIGRCPSPCLTYGLSETGSASFTSVASFSFGAWKGNPCFVSSSVCGMPDFWILP